MWTITGQVASLFTPKALLHLTTVEYIYRRLGNRDTGRNRLLQIDFNRIN